MSKIRIPYIVGAALAALLITASCGGQAKRTDTRTLEEAAIREVRAVSQARAAALERSEIEASLEAYTDDAVWIPSQSEEFIGKELARAKLKVFLDAVTIRETQQEEEHALLAPDVLLERGNYAAEVTPKRGGETATDGGTYMTVWRKGSDAKWRIAYQMWTSHGTLADSAPGPKGDAR